MDFLGRMTDAQAIVFFIWVVAVWNISWRLIERHSERKARSTQERKS